LAVGPWHNACLAGRRSRIGRVWPHGPYQIPPNEYDALVALYNAAGGANWEQAWSLPADQPCELYGVTCEGGHVVALDLDDNQLTGAIPAELGNLSNLEWLFLYSNQLTGAIPAEFTSLHSLYRFHFYDTALCEPQEAAFQAWIRGVSYWSGTGVLCPSQENLLHLPLIQAAPKAS